MWFPDSAKQAPETGNRKFLPISRRNSPCQMLSMPSTIIPIPPPRIPNANHSTHRKSPTYLYPPTTVHAMLPFSLASTPHGIFITCITLFTTAALIAVTLLALRYSPSFALLFAAAEYLPLSISPVPEVDRVFHVLRRLSYQHDGPLNASRAIHIVVSFVGGLGMLAAVFGAFVGPLLEDAGTSDAESDDDDFIFWVAPQERELPDDLEFHSSNFDRAHPEHRERKFCVVRSGDIFA